ncbi:hypothetical protein [uncultured Sphingomonas sp.]|uniref:hypothetical protein n=1 Tax=uncultured Sphingomonas sp. TaxID=158754 RepID=UPI0030FCD3CE
MNFTLLLLAFIVIGLPVILGVGSDMLKRWLKHKEKMADVMMQATAEKAAQYAAHTERLEQRVRVLERIVTDKGVALAEEIDALRAVPDQRPLN